MASPRLSGSSEKFGPVTTSQEFVTWEIPDIETSARMRRLIDSMGRSSLVLDANKYGGVTFDKDTRASFINRDDFGGGREDSAHQVRFGQLLLNGRDIHDMPELVAVKPFEDRADLYAEWAAHEYLNSLTDRQIGYINLGVHNDKHGVESIVSQYDHDVTTFDNSFWADAEESTLPLRPAVLQRHAKLGAQGLGFLHGVGVTHGDAQVKNLAADRFGFRVVDLEGADILTKEAQNDASIFTQTGRDIRAFIGSMSQVDENRGFVSDAFRSAQIRDQIAKSYVAGLHEGWAATNSPAARDVSKENRDLIRSQLDKIS